MQGPGAGGHGAYLAQALGGVPAREEQEGPDGLDDQRYAVGVVVQRPEGEQCAFETRGGFEGLGQCLLAAARLRAGAEVGAEGGLEVGAQHLCAAKRRKGARIPGFGGEPVVRRLHGLVVGLREGGPRGVVPPRCFAGEQHLPPPGEHQVEQRTRSPRLGIGGALEFGERQAVVSAMQGLQPGLCRGVDGVLRTDDARGSGRRGPDRLRPGTGQQHRHRGDNRDAAGPGVHASRLHARTVGARAAKIKCAGARGRAPRRVVRGRGMARADAVLFDLFDTLCRIDEPVYLEGKKATAALLGVRFDDFAAAWAASQDLAQVGALAGLEGRVRHVLATLGAPPPGREDLHRAIAMEREVLLRATSLHPDALPALRSLRQGPATRLALVSNASSAAEPLLEHLGLAPCFDAFAWSFRVGAMKPDAAIYLHACAALGVRPQGCVFVGDGNARELDGAQALGMRAVRIERTFSLGPYRREQSTRFDASIADLRRIADHLEV
jgi:putative hydrolase of the HAD superfamily